MNSREEIDKVVWADVAVAYQRCLRSFSTFIAPVLDSAGFKNIGISKVLLLLNVGFEERRVSDLIKNQHYVGSNVSYAISSLRQLGLIDGFLDEADKRIHFVRLTPVGAELVKAIRDHSEGDESDIQAALQASYALEERCETYRKLTQHRASPEAFGLAEASSHAS